MIPLTADRHAKRPLMADSKPDIHVLAANDKIPGEAADKARQLCEASRLDSRQSRTSPRSIEAPPGRRTGTSVWHTPLSLRDRHTLIICAPRASLSLAISVINRRGGGDRPSLSYSLRDIKHSFYILR
jgi:hypothetical protein